jgi:hypothetical protein
MTWMSATQASRLRSTSKLLCKIFASIGVDLRFNHSGRPAGFTGGGSGAEPEVGGPLKNEVLQP